MAGVFLYPKVASRQDTVSTFLFDRNRFLPFVKSGVDPDKLKRKKGATMPVARTMRNYRTTETEKALGSTSKHVLIGYLKSVKEAVSDAEVALAESEEERKKKIAEARAEVEAWNTKFRELSAKIIRAELSKNKKALSVPSSPRQWEERGPLDALAVSIANKSHQKELKNLFKEQPSHDVYWGAELIPSYRYGYYENTTPKMLTKWSENIDALIADLESRSNPDVYTAQIMDIRNQVERVLERFSLTPAVRKTIRKKRETK